MDLTDLEPFHDHIYQLRTDIWWSPRSSGGCAEELWIWIDCDWCGQMKAFWCKSHSFRFKPISLDWSHLSRSAHISQYGFFTRMHKTHYLKLVGITLLFFSFSLYSLSLYLFIKLRVSVWSFLNSVESPLMPYAVEARRPWSSGSRVRRPTGNQ
jgi:hypothetical protein